MDLYIINMFKIEIRNRHMSKNFLDTNTITLGELLGNGKQYFVPAFQRDYSWNEEQWEDLYDDIKNLQEHEYPHYMGTIVLQSSESKVFKIVDGQQRITTLSIFIIALIKTIQDLVDTNEDVEENKERIDILSRTYLGDKNPSSLMRTSKLKLNDNNNQFFSRYIVQMQDLRTTRGLNSSDKLLYNALKYFHSNLKSDLKGKNGSEIASYLTDNIADKLKFIQIKVEDELNAYTLFETLNARGIELTSTDLLKNYIFSQIKTKTDLELIQKDWNKISNTVGINEFPTYLRYYINSKNPVIRKDSLFKFVKKSVDNSEAAFKLVEELNELSMFYNALKIPNDDYWGGFGKYKELSKYLKALNLFKAKQQIPLLIAAITHFSENDFVELVKICMIISFRYNIISKLNPNEIEKTYNECAMKISNGKVKTPQESFDILKKVYIEDDEFKNNFLTVSIDTGKNKNLVRYILFSIENQLTNEDKDFEDSTATIEHILPENPNEDWDDFFSLEDMDKYVYRLGNYVLLESSINKKIGNKSYLEKEVEYKKSNFKITKELSNEKWTKEEIKKVQQKYAKIASSIWKINYRT